MSQGKALAVLCGIVIVVLIWTKPHYGPSACALLARESEQDTALVKQEYGLECDER